MEFILSSACQRALDIAFHLAFEQGKMEPDEKDCITALLNDPEGPVATLLKDFGLQEALLSSEKAIINLDISNTIFESAKKPHFSKKIAQISKKILTEQEGTSLGFLIHLVENFKSTKNILEELGINWEALTQWIDLQRPKPLVLDIPLDLNSATEFDSSLRILDAASNRVREGLRVIDDFCRFILNSHELCALTKKLRHDFNQSFNWTPATLFIFQRNIDEDIGTNIHTNQEMQRLDSLDVFKANIKRVQESLRSIEEFGKLESPDFSLSISDLRYRSYDLEQRIYRLMDLSSKLIDIKIYGLLGQEQLNPKSLDMLESLLENGLDMVQLRIKNIPDNKMLDYAYQMKSIVRQKDKLLIINDRPDIAKIIDADGVHLGQEDLPLKEAKSILGKNKIIGISTHNEDQLQEAINKGADYVGIGPVFKSKTKNFENLAGVNFVKAAHAVCKIPYFAIGGITLENIIQLTNIGVSRIAVCNSLFNSDNPLKTLKQFKQVLQI